MENKNRLFVVEDIEYSKNNNINGDYFKKYDIGEEFSEDFEGEKYYMYNTIGCIYEIVNDLIVIGINKDAFESISDEILKKVNRQNELKNIFVCKNYDLYNYNSNYNLEEEIDDFF